MKKTKNEYWFRRYPKIALVSVVVFSMTPILFLVELIFVLTDLPDRNKHWSRNARSLNLVEYLPMIESLAPPTDEYRSEYNIRGLEQRDYIFRTDSSGYIMPSKLYTNPDLTIAFLGGSTTENKYVREENRFPNLSRNLLEEQTGKKINSLNAGLARMHSMNGINILINKLVPEKPDYVVFMYCINDLTTIFHTGTYWNSSSRNLVNAREHNSFLKKVESFTKLFIPKISERIRTMLIKQSKDEWRKYRNETARTKNDLIYESYRSSLNNFVTTCKSWNIQPILMTQPNRLRSEKPDFKQSSLLEKRQQDYVIAYERMTEIIRETAVEHDIPLIDLEQTIPKDTLHLYDIVHMNDTGNKLAAKKIANVLGSILEESVKNEEAEILGNSNSL